MEMRWASSVSSELGVWDDYAWKRSPSVAFCGHRRCHRILRLSSERLWVRLPVGTCQTAIQKRMFSPIGIPMTSPNCRSSWQLDQMISTQSGAQALMSQQPPVVGGKSQPSWDKWWCVSEKEAVAGLFFTTVHSMMVCKEKTRHRPVDFLSNEQPIGITLW